MSVEVAIKNGAQTIGEGPHWDYETGTLLYVDIMEGDVHRWSPSTGVDEKIHLESPVSLIVPNKNGGYIVAQNRSICHLVWDTAKLTTIHTVEEGTNNRFNDGKCDRNGRLWAGNRRVAVHVANGFPDGMTIDTEDKLWVACFSAGRVVRYDPETGKELRVIEIPSKRTTSCCFGGENLEDLYVTSCAKHVSVESLTLEEVLKQEPLAGSVFRVTGLGVRGHAANKFDGILVI